MINLKIQRQLLKLVKIRDEMGTQLSFFFFMLAIHVRKGMHFFGGGRMEIRY